MDITKYTRLDSQSESADMVESEDAILLTKDVSSLSSVGITTHCLHLLDTHFKLFVTILLLVVIPTMTPWKEAWVHFRSSLNPVSVDNVAFNHTSVGAPIAIENSTAVANPSDILNSTAPAFNLSSSGAGVGNQDPADLSHLKLHWKDFDFTPGIVKAGLAWKRQVRIDWTTTPMAASKALLILIFNKLLMVTLVSIHRCFVVYTAGRIQVGKRATFLDAVRAFRVLWKRVIGTRICFEIMEFASTVFLYSPTLFFDKYEDGRSHLLYWLTFTTMVLHYAFYLCSEFAFQLVTYVPILDQACGWEAFGRGWRLLKGKKRVSVGIAVCSLMAYAVVVTAIGTVGFVTMLGYLLSQGKLPDFALPNAKPQSPRFIFYTLVITAMVQSVHVLFTEMLYAVFCMSCMAFHQQSLVRSSFFQKLTKTGRDHDC